MIYHRVLTGRHTYDRETDIKTPCSKQVGIIVHLPLFSPSFAAHSLNNNVVTVVVRRISRLFIKSGTSEKEQFPQEGNAYNNPLY